MATTIQNIELPKKPRARDTSGNNNHGEIYSGRGLEFDGVTDYLSIADDASIRPTDNITVACWVHRNNTVASYETIFGKSNGWPYGVWVSTISGQLRCELDGAISHDDFKSSAGAMDLNTWYRIVVTYNTTDGGVMYINGQIVDTIAANGSITQPTSTAYQIGGSGSYFFNGNMSDFQLWDAVFTQADVTYDYLNPESLALNASGTALTEGNLKLWYPMQDGHRGQQSYILDGANTGLGVELVTDGDFATGLGGWTAGGGWSYGDQEVVADGSTNEANLLTQDLGLVEGSTYKISFNNNWTSGVMFVRDADNTTLYTLNSGSGIDTQTFNVNWTSSGGTLKFYAYSYEGSIDNISVKAINDKHHATTVFYGDELVTNGTFAGVANGTDVITLSGWTAYNAPISRNIESEKLEIVASGSNQGAILSITTTVGRTYKLQYTATGDTGASGIYINGISGVNTSTETTYSFVAIATTTAIYFRAATNAAGTTYYDDISFKEVGVASGWTDADQQLHIPQTALQSYNELAWATDWGEQVEIADHNDFSFDTDNNDDPFSLSAWVYVADFTGSFFVFTKGGYSSSRHQLEYRLQINSSGIVYFYLHDGPTTDGGSSNHLTYARWFTATNTIEKGKWYNIVTTYSGTTPSGTSDTNGKIYVNGVELSTTSSQASYARMSNQAHSLMMHKAGQSGSFGAPGSITEAAVWNKALSAAEVVELFNDGKALEASAHSAYSSVLGYWRNNGLSTWTNIKNPGTHDGVVTDFTETILIPEGVDTTRDSQGFLMNKKRSTGSLNLTTNTIADGIGDGNMVKVGNVDLGTTDFSICFWAYKFRDWNEQWVISQYTDSSNRWYIRGNSSNPPNFTIFAVGSGSAVLQDTDNTSLDEAAYIENWMHVALTVDRSDTSNGIQWYINGEATSNGGVSAGQTGTSLSSTNNLTIGADKNPNFSDHHFDGKIDGVLVYTDRLLDSTEVLKNYNATKRDHAN